MEEPEEKGLSGQRAPPEEGLDGRLRASSCGDRSRAVDKVVDGAQNPNPRAESNYPQSISLALKRKTRTNIKGPVKGTQLA